MTEALLTLAAASAGEHVLDIGCGSGTHDAPTRRARRSRRQRVGSTFAPMLAVRSAARAHRASRAQFIDADATDYPFEPKRFDLAFSQFCVMVLAIRSPRLRMSSQASGGRPAHRFVCWRAPTENPWSTVPESAPAVAAPMEPLPPDAPAAMPLPIQTGSRAFSCRPVPRARYPKFDAHRSISAIRPRPPPPPASMPDRRPDPRRSR